MQKLTDLEIARELQDLPGWEHHGNALTRVFDRRSFHGAVAFVNTLSEIAERANHHPDIDIRFTKVRVSLSTHDAGGITASDMGLARQITAAAD